jgi:hypothetical protein
LVEKDIRIKKNHLSQDWERYGFGLYPWDVGFSKLDEKIFPWWKQKINSYKTTVYWRSKQRFEGGIYVWTANKHYWFPSS